MHLPGPSWYRQPGRHLPTYIFSQEANPQPQVSKDATEKRVARTAAYFRSGMDENELHGHLSEKLFRAIGSISEEIYYPQAVYFSYT